MDFVANLIHFPGTKSGFGRQIDPQILALRLASNADFGKLFKLWVLKHLYLKDG